MVCKPNSVCGAKAPEAAIYLSDLPIAPPCRSWTSGGPPLSNPEGVDGAIYAVLHPVGFVLSRSTKSIGIPCGTVVIADDAVVSYTTFSPFPVDLAVIGMCVFCDTVRSCGMLPARPTIDSWHRALGCSDFPPRSGEPVRSDCPTTSFLPQQLLHWLCGTRPVRSEPGVWNRFRGLPAHLLLCSVRG